MTAVTHGSISWLEFTGDMVAAFRPRFAARRITKEYVESARFLEHRRSAELTVTKEIKPGDCDLNLSQSDPLPPVALGLCHDSSAEKATAFLHRAPSQVDADGGSRS